MSTRPRPQLPARGGAAASLFRWLLQLIRRVLDFWRGGSSTPAAAPVGCAVLCKVNDPGDAHSKTLGEVGEKIGKGTFGTVHEYRCRQHRASDGGRLCVKVVPLGAQQADGRGRIHEVERPELRQLMLELRSPHVVQHHSFEHVGASLHVVLDRCEGPDLPDHLEARGGTLPFAELRALAAQILGAVGAIHAAGIMHRDLKLENFRFHDRATATLKLLDFGAAKPASRAPQAHTVTGTLLYVAPEVFDGVYCHACDLWSAGVVLFQLATGTTPFNTPDVVVLRSLHRDPLLTGDCLLRGEVWRTAPVAARGLVRGLLTVDPAWRLAADAALSHPWLTGPAVDHGPEASGDDLSEGFGEDSDPGSPCVDGGEPEDGSSALRRSEPPCRLGRKQSLLSDLDLIAGNLIAGS